MQSKNQSKSKTRVAKLMQKTPENQTEHVLAEIVDFKNRPPTNTPSTILKLRTRHHLATQNPPVRGRSSEPPASKKPHSQEMQSQNHLNHATGGRSTEPPGPGEAGPHKDRRSLRLLRKAADLKINPSSNTSNIPISQSMPLSPCARHSPSHT